MSDFDKEAEREKLREKYERDRKEREATQRMSDLLLKGATMTNTHCDVCGDPIFRMNGTAFCPSCHGGPGGVEGAAPDDGSEQSDANDAAEGTANASGTAPGSADGGESETVPGTTADAGSATDPASDRSVERPSSSNADRSDVANATPDGASRSDADARSADHAGDAGRADDRLLAGSGDDRSPANRDERPSRQPPTTGGAGDIDAARDSLRRTLERFSREAAESDDPRHARACLEAAREAAETLSALRR